MIRFLPSLHAQPFPNATLFRARSEDCGRGRDLGKWVGKGRICGRSTLLLLSALDLSLDIRYSRVPQYQRRKVKKRRHCSWESKLQLPSILSTQSTTLHFLKVFPPGIATSVLITARTSFYSPFPILKKKILSISTS